VSSKNNLDRAAQLIVIILLALLPFHAFGWTWFKSFFWTENWTIWVQAWKEILVGILAILAVIKFKQTRKLPNSRIFWLSVIFIILAIFYALFGNGVVIQKVLGLRTITLFLVAFLAVQFFSFDKQTITQLKKIALLSAVVVSIFALAQKFILPPDFLRHFGYSTNVSCWLPGGNLPMYHLVEGRENLIRLQSTFAGPNQLAAYLLVILPLAVVKFWHEKKWQRYLAIFIFISEIGGIFWAYSRSAWIGGVGMLLAFIVQNWQRTLSRQLRRKITTCAVISTIGLCTLGLINSNLREILVRESSTSMHLERSAAAAQLMLKNPLGLGLGQTAGISQRFTDNTTPENTYLGIALDLGWIGGALFLAIILALLIDLRKSESELFYSLLGITIIAIFLHPFEDTPTAIILFLLIGMDLNQNIYKIHSA